MTEPQVFHKSQPATLSIGIPAYNRPEWLKRAILSILSTPTTLQQQIEIIVSDDSTITQCGELAQTLLKNWQGPWHYQANQPSLGMAGNWNCCLQLASGRYVMLLHDDDYLEPKATVQILKILHNNPEPAAVLFGVNVVTEQQKIRKRQVAKTEQFLTRELALIHLLSNSSFIRFPGIVLKRQVFNTLGYFDEEIGGISDIQMWLRVANQYGLLQVPIVTANYTVHKNALTMAMFNPEVVAALDQLFLEAKMQHWLPENTLEKCKANYFHQFILAGTIRFFRIGKFKEARIVLSLFEKVSLNANQAKLKWKIIRTFLSAL